jgi:hypothetical protein
VSGEVFFRGPKRGQGNKTKGAGSGLPPKTTSDAIFQLAVNSKSVYMRQRYSLSCPRCLPSCHIVTSRMEDLMHPSLPDAGETGSLPVPIRSSLQGSLDPLGTRDLAPAITHNSGRRGAAGNWVGIIFIFSIFFLYLFFPPLLRTYPRCRALDG